MSGLTAVAAPELTSSFVAAAPNERSPLGNGVCPSAHIHILRREFIGLTCCVPCAWHSVFVPGMVESKIHADILLPVDAVSPCYVWFMRLSASVTIIQRVWRGYQGRRRFLKMVEQLVFGDDTAEISLIVPCVSYSRRVESSTSAHSSADTPPPVFVSLGGGGGGSMLVQVIVG
mgnify:CR=1 FL=1